MRDAEPLNICGPQVRYHRNRRGWSQAQLAARCQIAKWDATRIVIAKIEGQSRRVTDAELVTLARVLDVEVGALLPPRSAN